MELQTRIEESKQEQKLWEIVNSNPSAFDSWTSLLQIVEQKVGYTLLIIILKKILFESHFFQKKKE